MPSALVGKARTHPTLASVSLVSLPNYDINSRINLNDKKYMNKITKGVYELGSIFKTFTVAIALDNNLVIHLIFSSLLSAIGFDNFLDVW